MSLIRPNRRPNHHARLTAATIRGEGALALFSRALEQLDAAALDAENVAEEVADEMRELELVRADARKAQGEAVRRAAKIRELIR